MEKTANIINQKLMELGFINDPDVTNEGIGESFVKNLIETKKMQPWDLDDIDVNTLGIFRHCFTEIEYELTIGIHKNDHGLWPIIDIHYSWKHPMGSNGSSVRFDYDIQTKEWGIQS